MSSKHCCIFAAGEYPQRVAPYKGCYLNSFENDDAFIIACDKGYEQLVSFGFEPDLVIGDFDSLGYVPEGVKVKKHPCEKDQTDTELAVEYALSEGCDHFTIYGALGGRIDHSIANINLAARLAKMGKACVLIGKDEKAMVTVGRRGSVLIGKKGARFSVFSLDDESDYLCISKGAKYPLNGVTLKNTDTVGVSNEMVKCEVKLYIADGAILTVMDDMVTLVVNNIPLLGDKK